MNDAAMVKDDLEARIAQAFEAALDAAEKKQPDARRKWDEYMELRNQRSPATVARMEQERMQQVLGGLEGGTGVDLDNRT